MRKSGLCKRIKRLANFFSGYNLVIGLHIRRQLNFLKDNIPASFQNKQMDDLGCGDGKVTLLLKKIFLPKKLRGFDINPSLVRQARKKGIEAEVRNLDDELPTGELAVMWGALHHLEDMAGCLKKLRENYKLIFIREPVKTSSINWLETGHPLKKEEIKCLVKEYLPDSQTFSCGNSILIFYISPELDPASNT